jgi:hypothetical protein
MFLGLIAIANQLDVTSSLAREIGNGDTEPLPIENGSTR